MNKQAARYYTIKSEVNVNGHESFVVLTPAGIRVIDGMSFEGACKWVAKQEAREAQALADAAE
jgi:hypothetical protein